MNRSDLIGRLLTPMLDKNQSDVMHVSPIAVDGAYVISTETTHYTVPASGVYITVVQRIRIVNTAASDLRLDVHLVQSGGARGAANQIWKRIIAAKSAVTIPGPWFLAPGDTIRTISADAGVTDIALRVDVVEFATQPSGLTIPVDQGDLLTATAATYYTAPTTGLTKAILAALTLCNTDAAARSVQVWLIPNGQTAANRYRLIDETLAPAQTLILPDQCVLDPGDFLQAAAGAASVVSFRATVLECE